MVRGQKILIFSGPGIENIDFQKSGDKKSMVWGTKILIFGGPGSVLGGGHGRGRVRRPGSESWTP